MSDASLSERLLKRAFACPWVVCRSDGLVRVLSGEYAEQLRIPTESGATEAIRASKKGAYISKKTI